MQIISGYLRGKFAKDKPLTLSASLCFEQSYSGVDGDSASVAEVAAQAAVGPVRRIGVRDFAESGDPAGLYRKYGLSSEHIVAEAEKLLR